jgi:oligoendopeptidase F
MNGIRSRSEVPASDRWDLTLLYPTEEKWEQDFAQMQKDFSQIKQFKGTLASSPESLRRVLDFESSWERRAEKIAEYAHLKLTEDVANPVANDRLGRFTSLATQAGAAFSFITPEIQAISDEVWNEWIVLPFLSEYQISLTKIRRYKPHVLSEESERVLALAQEVTSTPQRTFSQLTNADLDFGQIVVDGSTQPLTQSSYSVFLQNPDRNVRRSAYDQFYSEFQAHSNTLAALLTGNVHQDVWLSRVRGYTSCRAKALFADNVPEVVYDNLLYTVRSALPSLHRYYELRRKALKLDRLHHSDVYAPLVPELKKKTTFNEAVDVVTEAVSPLGEEYQRVLKQGLTGGWVDRYENQGKRSGAFSSGCYDSQPYILLNFNEENFRDVFTLAHEAGHSMHTWFSVRNNPFQHYIYTIFEAEVASTFNEQLLANLLLKKAQNEKERAALLSKLVEDTVATLFRQTMFAEFEHLIHSQVEKGNALTLESLRSTYRGLLEAYFGPSVELPEVASLEALRIPHFYNSFYVYKYATGLSASMALSERVLNGAEAERQQYLAFLKSGGSRFPLDSLKLAGVDMTSPSAIQSALKSFDQRLEELEGLL